MTTQTDLATRIATEAHKGQTRWDKTIPYITHPAAVARALIQDGYDEDYVATAWLHDVLEDTDVTERDLMTQGVDPFIIDAVVLLTHTEGLSYLDYILTLSTHSVARVVKMADLTHNMSNLKKGSMLQKYQLAFYILEREL
jgi:(p)ppGpp synthase/HD superfamily hydrolase